MSYTVRPISDRTRFTGKRRYSQFDSSWPKTERLLLAEIGRLKGKNVVLEVDVRDADIRIDGRLKANARPATPGVRVVFDAADGATHHYATDRFTTWQDNARAIALGLEALRKIERYGIAESDQQYLGFKALPPGRDAQIPAMSTDDACDLIVSVVGGAYADPLKGWKAARRRAHPDHNDGDRELWNKLEEAGKALGYLR